MIPTDSLTLVCPLAPDDIVAEPARVVVDDGAPALLSAEERAAFEDYFVVRTRETVDAFLANVVPTIGRYDSEMVTSQLEHSELDVALPAGVDLPVAIFVARGGTYVGWRQVAGLLDAYLRASAHVIADAGHALPHERPDIVGRLLALADV